METESRCSSCVDAVVENPGLLIAAPGDPDPAWMTGADGQRHWARVVKADRRPIWLGVCGARVSEG